MTTSYFYSYIETSSYQTTYTITLKARQSRYSLTGEWWESNDGKNWHKVTSTTGRDGQSCSSSQVRCFERQVCYYDGNHRWLGCEQYNVIDCSNGNCFGPQSPTASQLASSLTANGRRIVGFNPPIILYFTANESIVVSAGRISYTASGVRWLCTQQELGYTTICVESREVCTTFAGGIVGCRTECLKYKSTSYYQCVQEYTEWSRTYQLQAIELVDWDTGEVYASLNQTSLTFNINANTIVRFKYVLTSSWSRSWEVILQPPPPTPDQCPQILNNPNARCTIDWCSCLRQFDPEAWRNEECCQPKSRSCLSVSVDFCCSGDEQYSCLDSRSGGGGRNCVEFTVAEVQQGVTKPLSPVSWSASWRLMGPWVYDRIVQVGNYNPPYCTASVSGNSASGECCIALSRGRCADGNVGPNENYSTTIVIVFKKT
jgi:hypothetical protein